MFLLGVRLRGERSGVSARRGRRKEPEKLIEEVGTRISEIRVGKGWTQAELAGRLGVSLTYLRRCESGTANLSLRTLARIADALEVDPIALLERPHGTSTSMKDRQ